MEGKIAFERRSSPFPPPSGAGGRLWRCWQRSSFEATSVSVQLIVLGIAAY